MIYYIPAWEKTFENAQSRRVTGPLKWVAMPTDQQSREYKRILRSEHGPSVFGAWCAIVELGARMSTRGVFEDADGPLDAEDIADETGFPLEIIKHAISVLSSPKIKWLRKKNADEVGERSECSRSIVDKSVPTLHNTTGHNITVHKGRGEEVPPPPPDPELKSREDFEGGLTGDAAYVKWAARMYWPRTPDMPIDNAIKDSGIDDPAERSKVVSAFVDQLHCIGDSEKAFPLNLLKGYFRKGADNKPSAPIDPKAPIF